MGDVSARYLPCGDTGLTVQFEGRGQSDLNAIARHLHEALAQSPPVGVRETVPTFRTVLIHYDPGQTSQQDLIERVRRMLPDLAVGSHSEGRLWEFPVCFEGDEFGTDLGLLANLTGLPAADIVDGLTQVTQTVQMLGFAPGLPYLGDLPEHLAVPRRKDPVASVPAGAVLTATGKTVLYPVKNPTGWYVAGRTPIKLFRPTADAPVLLRPGDRVRFRAISAAEFSDIDPDHVVPVSEHAEGHPT